MPDTSSKSKKSTPQESPILTFMKEAMNIPEYRQMMDYLQQRKGTPEIDTKQRNLGRDTYGVYERNSQFGNELPAAGRITLDKKAGTDTLVHEIVHAVNYQMAVQNSQEPFDRMTQPKKSQFGDAYSKLRWDPYERDPSKKDKVTQVIEAIAPDAPTPFKSYRLTSGEAPAFAVSKHLTDPQAKSAGNVGAPSHIDATLATEFLILLDQAQRASSQSSNPSKK